MSPTILITDDCERVRTALGDWLKAVLPKWQVSYASSGEEAVEHVRTHKPRVVLMDIGLPGINGLEATRRIKAEQPETEVVIVTVYDDAPYRAEALAAGADGFVAKCSMYRELLPALDKLLDGKDLQEIRNPNIETRNKYQ